MIRQPTLAPGKTYIVTYRLLGARKDSQLTGKFLYSDEDHHYFDCRPDAGTQKVSRDRVMRLQTPR
jgi:hypothetical protein